MDRAATTHTAISATEAITNMTNSVPTGAA